MILDKQWRILTVGDGDLSFSYALHNLITEGQVTASTYDSQQTIEGKYQHHALEQVKAANITYLPEFDVTMPASWQRLAGQKFDLVVFQFPLIPAFSDQQAFDKSTLSINTLNRALLRQFIDNACRFALDPNGPMLCYITSKDVKPYCEWDLESSLTLGSKMRYIGQHPFNIKQFPGYKIRNVERDKHVKDTSGITYAFTAKSNPLLEKQLTIPSYLGENHCSFCRAGPFYSRLDMQAHLDSKKHRMMQKHQQAWYQLLDDYHNKDPYNG